MQNDQRPSSEWFWYLRNHARKRAGLLLFLFLGATEYVILSSKIALKKYEMCR